MLSMKTLKVDVEVRKQYVVSLHGTPLGTFEEMERMAEMKLLKNEKGEQLVLDFPSDFSAVMSAIIGTKENPQSEATVMKLAPTLMDDIQKIVDANTTAPETSPEGDKKDAE